MQSYCLFLKESNVVPNDVSCRPRDLMSSPRSHVIPRDLMSSPRSHVVPDVVSLNSREISLHPFRPPSRYHPQNSVKVNFFRETFLTNLRQILDAYSTRICCTYIIVYFRMFLVLIDIRINSILHQFVAYFCSIVTQITPFCLVA